MEKTFKFQIQSHNASQGIRTSRHTYPLPPSCTDVDDCTTWVQTHMAEIMAAQHIDMVIDFVILEIDGVKCGDEFVEQPEQKEQKSITYLFENNRLADSDTVKFVQKIDKNYIEINTQVLDWSREADYWLFARLIDPTLKNIVSSSGFVTGMPSSYVITFDKKLSINEDDFDPHYPQLAYFAYMIQQAIYYRQKHNMQPLHLHLNYIEPNDLMHDIIVNEKFHRDCSWSVRAMLRQCENFINIHVYKEYKLQKTYTNEDELPFTVSS